MRPCAIVLVVNRNWKGTPRHVYVVVIETKEDRANTRSTEYTASTVEIRFPFTRSIRIHTCERNARALSISHALLITHMKCTRFGARSRFFAAISNNQSKANQYDDENQKLHAWRLLYFTLILRMSIATHMECCMLYLLMCAMAQISKTFLQRRQNKRRPIFTLRFVFTSLRSTLSQICRIVSTQRFLISSVHHCNDIVCWVLFFFWLFSMILWCHIYSIWLKLFDFNNDLAGTLSKIDWWILLLKWMHTNKRCAKNNVHICWILFGWWSVRLRTIPNRCEWEKKSKTQ